MRKTIFYMAMKIRLLRHLKKSLLHAHAFVLLLICSFCFVESGCCVHGRKENLCSARGWSSVRPSYRSILPRRGVPFQHFTKSIINVNNVHKQKNANFIILKWSRATSFRETNKRNCIQC